MGEEKPGAQVPRLRLDELVDELQSRMDEVRGARNRLNGLLDAVMRVGQELGLSQVLSSIVEAAVELVDARYGALGMIGDDQRLAEFVPVGVSDELRAKIGGLPAGQGLLGELIKHPEPLRLAELTEHAASSGFPEHHPEMHSFLGVPIRVRDEVVGNIYLTEKRGQADFDAEDEAVLTTLAVAAGFAIDNARLFEEARFRERWLAASSEFTNALLSGETENQVLERMLKRAMDITASDTGVFYLVGPAGELRGSLALGEGADRHRGLVRASSEGTLAAAALARDGPVLSSDVAADERTSREHGLWPGSGPAVAVAVGTKEKFSGVLTLARRSGRTPFAGMETEPLSDFARQAALALELADRRRASEQTGLLEEHERIARDLHDLAIQRLFATGMTLQSVQHLVDQPEASERLMRAIDDLDTTIKIIRGTIFGLREHEATGEAPKLRVRIVRATERAAQALGFVPALRVEGLIDTDVPTPVADEVVAVVSEALTNVARHAQARRVQVAVSLEEETLTVTVEDDGVGIRPGIDHSGLRNLEERARKLGGAFEVTPQQSGTGTHLEWRVPVSCGDA